MRKINEAKKILHRYGLQNCNDKKVVKSARSRNTYVKNKTTRSGVDKFVPRLRQQRESTLCLFLHFKQYNSQNREQQPRLLL